MCCRQIEEAFPANSRSGSQTWDGIDRHAKSKLHSEASNFNTSFSHHHDKTKDSWQSLKKFPFYEHSEMLCTYSAVCERNHLSKCYYLRVTGNATYYFLLFFARNEEMLLLFLSKEKENTPYPLARCCYLHGAMDC